MSGHSKWANIKHRKGVQDEKKSKVFGQFSRLIRVAVREGGSGDPAANPTLRTILDKAREADMPKENVQRAIDRGLGKSSAGVQIQEVVYEGYGPGGIGILATAVTDNLNRTSAEIRNLFTHAGGSLGGPGSVMYMFRRAAGEEGYVCTAPIPIADPQVRQQLQQLLDNLLEHDDIEEVFSAGVLE